MGKIIPYYRRHLPHFQPLDATYHVVFRLAGSLPAGAVQNLRSEWIEQEKQLVGVNNSEGCKSARKERRDEYFKKFDELLADQNSGPHWLGESEIAEIIAEAIHYRDGKEYDLLVYCIMPNHVHMIFNVGRPDWSSDIAQDPSFGKTVGRRGSSTYIVTDILENLKWYTAFKCNKILNRTGAFWQHESYDRVIRENGELENTILYVLNNPVKAGLVESWEKWQWSYCKERLTKIE